MHSYAWYRFSNRYISFRFLQLRLLFSTNLTSFLLQQFMNELVVIKGIIDKGQCLVWDVKASQCCTYTIFPLLCIKFPIVSYSCYRGYNHARVRKWPAYLPFLISHLNISNHSPQKWHNEAFKHYDFIESWPIMSWLLVSPAHRQLWYWQCRINGALSSKKKGPNCLRHEKCRKMQI